MSEAPAELWLRCSTTGHWWQTRLEPREPSAVRYVRADLYEAMLDLAATLAKPESQQAPLEAIQEWQRLQR